MFIPLYSGSRSLGFYQLFHQLFARFVRAFARRSHSRLLEVIR